MHPQTARLLEEPGRGVADEEARLLASVRQGDESAFASIVERHGGAMLRFARAHTADRALAEDAVQDAWLGFLQGLHRYEGRASLRSWLFGILLHRLQTRLRRDGHLVPDGMESDVAQRQSESPEEILLEHEVRAVVDAAIAALPAVQRQVITLRDLEGWSSAEVCTALLLSDSNQRVLLHRARSRVRQAIALYLADGREEDAPDESDPQR